MRRKDKSTRTESQLVHYYERGKPRHPSDWERRNALKTVVRRRIMDTRGHVINTIWSHTGLKAPHVEQELLAKIKAEWDTAVFNKSIKNDPQMRPLPCKVELGDPFIT